MGHGESVGSNSVYKGAYERLVKLPVQRPSSSCKICSYRDSQYDARQSHQLVL